MSDEVDGLEDEQRATLPTDEVSRVDPEITNRDKSHSHVLSGSSKLIKLLTARSTIHAFQYLPVIYTV